MYILFIKIKKSRGCLNNWHMLISIIGEDEKERVNRSIVDALHTSSYIYNDLLGSYMPYIMYSP